MGYSGLMFVFLCELPYFSSMTFLFTFNSDLPGYTAPGGGSVPGMCGAELFPAGRGEDENPRDGVGRGEDENPRGGAKKRVNQLI